MSKGTSSKKLALQVLVSTLQNMAKGNQRFINDLTMIAGTIPGFQDDKKNADTDFDSLVRNIITTADKMRNFWYKCAKMRDELFSGQKVKKAS